MAEAPLLDLYDEEILAAEAVLKKLNESQKKQRNLEAFQQEIRGRFEEIGLVVKPKVYETNQEGVYYFDVDIVGRTDEIQWDPDKQVHQVRNDILDLLPASEKGQWIKSKGGLEMPSHKH